jgi:hypothetical protein
MSTCCNRFGLSVRGVCGEFETPQNPDTGRCYPKPTKIDCEAPVLPVNQCNDTSAYAIPDPLHPGKFLIIGTLFDEDCNPILDEGGNPILTQIA